MNRAQPEFQLLDIVVASPSETDWRFSGRGWICQVRQYGDGGFAYVVAPFDVEEVGAVFDPSELRATGERHSANDATRAGPFRLREVVRVMTASLHSPVVGLTGVVVGPCNDACVCVRIDELGEVFAVPTAELESTGVRRPSTRPAPRQSVRVNQHGEVLGGDDYVVLQDMDDI